MKIYIEKSSKALEVQKIINEALYILESVGIPLHTKSQRGLEKMAMCFLAVAGVNNDWKIAKSSDDGFFLKTRDIIVIINSNFEEEISSGSYDDIRRKDLKFLLLADLVVKSADLKKSATNNPTRGYAVNPRFKQLIVAFGSDDWDAALAQFNQNNPSLADILARNRNLPKVAVKLSTGQPLELSVGEHNQLQKAIIEEFLSRFGKGCEVLYVGDTSNKALHVEETALKDLHFFELSHDELPDIVAYDRDRNWLYLIEAVHSSGPISEVRLLELKRLLHECKAELIFITAFLTRTDFKKWMMHIAWETEVWIADNPDHMIHFNGHKFLGAY